MRFILKVCILLCCIGIYASAQQQTQEKPNFIIILADDLGYNDVSCYRDMLSGQGESAPTCMTPNIDKLAAAGMLFTDFYSGAAVCSPSRSALITGRNASRNGIYNWVPENSPMHLRSEEVTIAEMLKPQGYQTAHFGKWHLTSGGTNQPIPNDQGYNYSFFTHNNALPSHKNPVNFMRNGEPVGELNGYSCQLVVDEAIDWLEERKNKEEPYYINVWFNEPHEKVAAPEELTSRHERHPKYYGAIENMDLAIGRLMDYLEETGLDQNTLIIFTSDNGSQVRYSNTPFRGAKCLNYEGGIRVPFIVKYHGVVPEGSVKNTPGHFTDVLPTLAAFTGSKLPTRTLDGADLSAVFKNEEEKVERVHPIFFYRYFHDPVCMIREDKWVLLGYDNPLPYAERYDIKAIANLQPKPGKPTWSMWGFQPVHMNFIKKQKVTHFELYDINEDIGQRKNVAARHPEVVKKLKKKMLLLKKGMVKEGGDWFD